MDQLSESELKDVLINPYYAISFDAHVFIARSEGAKEDWVIANVHMIDDIGAKAWLIELLNVLSQTRKEYDGHDLLDPTIVTNVSRRLHGEHVPLVTRDQWVQANAKLIDELGADIWLYRLLEVLATGGPEA